MKDNLIEYFGQEGFLWRMGSPIVRIKSKVFEGTVVGGSFIGFFVCNNNFLLAFSCLSRQTG